MSDIVLKLQKVTKVFGGRGNVPSIEIFKGMDFTIKRNEVVGLFSPSGSGKTTFLQIAGLLDSKFSGNIYINGSRVDAKNDFQTSIIRRKNIGFVFQFHHLIQEFSAIENITFPLLFDGISKKTATKKAQHLLEKDGAFELAEITKLAIEAKKNKKVIRKFFSKQSNKALLIYILGDFTDLNFDKDNGLFISLDSKPEMFYKGFTNKEWLSLKKLCKL